eukprot:6209935-Pleurochrysis_carterae.AAC.2
MNILDSTKRVRWYLYTFPPETPGRPINNISVADASTGHSLGHVAGHVQPLLPAIPVVEACPEICVPIIFP